ncbi:hypothetical protein SAY87_009079 [Trapa incisa]|uniref:Uncharacterized protein n=2 Tax=Trapa TaxID=22665 RepID=A0AAN7M4G7_TRANT|nr:hypothetical protein SAY87_009079 [Trapa incisa]KAK4798564.1 hypothetical protein SAY86_030890 [Trapa natans]
MDCTILTKMKCTLAGHNDDDVEYSAGEVPEAQVVITSETQPSAIDQIGRQQARGSEVLQDTAQQCRIITAVSGTCFSEVLFCSTPS